MWNAWIHKFSCEILTSNDVDEATIQHVINIIENVSFKGGNTEKLFSSIRIGYRSRCRPIGQLLEPLALPERLIMEVSKIDLCITQILLQNFIWARKNIKNSQAPTINHFYEKLLLLKDKMNTETGNKLPRHRYMGFLSQFYANGTAKVVCSVQFLSVRSIQSQFAV